MKKQKKLLLALVMALVLAGSGGSIVSAASTDGIIKSGKTLENANNGNKNKDKDEDKDENEGTGNDGGGSSNSSNSGSMEFNAGEVDAAVSTVTVGSKVDQSAINEAATALSGLTGFFQTIMGMALVIISAWIPLTFVADILVYYIPFLDRWIGDGGGAGAPSGPNGTGGKGFHIKLTSNHRLGGGSAGGPAGPGGAGGGAGAQWGEYIKSRAIELVYTFGIIGLLVSGMYTVLLNTVVHYLMLIINAILGLIKGILDGLLKQ